MKPTLIQTDFSIQAFQVNQVIFDDSDLVSVEGYCNLEGACKKTTLLFTFSMFNDLLRLSGSVGEQLQLQISNKLLGKEEPPYIIATHNQPILFSNVQFQLAYLISGDQSCLSVEGIKPLSFLQQAKNLKQNFRDFQNVQLVKDSLANHALKDLAGLYRYYVGLLELNCTETASREKAGLQNDKIFKIAYYAAKSN